VAAALGMASIPAVSKRSHRALIVWQRAMELVQETYRLTCAYPKAERYGLVGQLRESAVSIPANIAEGNARRTTRDYLRFLAMANGSLRELETYFEVSEIVGYASATELVKPRALADEVARMLTRLTQSLQRKLPPPPDL